MPSDERSHASMAKVVDHTLGQVKKWVRREE
jgi:hypothetical protein